MNKTEREIEKIKKQWNKYLRKEIMWFFGIHIIRSARAEVSSNFEW